MPEIDRGTSVAYCESVGPLETVQLPTRFAVCPASTAWPAEQVRAYYREYNNHTLHTITVHEAMPGHVEQLSHARRYRDDTLIRSVFDSSLFIEGWAVYAEELMVERGYRSEVSADAARAQRVLQLRLQLRRVLATVLDVSIHVGDMDQAAAVDLMTGRGYIAKDEAARRWSWLQLVATQPPLYYVGLLEVRQLVADLRSPPRLERPEAARHDAQLRLATGPTPTHPARPATRILARRPVRGRPTTLGQPLIGRSGSQFGVPGSGHDGSMPRRMPAPIYRDHSEVCDLPR